jgi:hypothetical protein
MEISQKDLLNISGGVLSCFEASHYLNECNQLKVFRQSAKYNVNRTFEDLKKIEIDLYDKIEEVDKKGLQAKKTDNNLAFFEWLLTTFDYSKVQKLKEVCLAFSLDENRITSISDKIHQQNGAKKV